MDVFGQALRDYYNGQKNEKLLLHNSYGAPEEMPVEVFFRGEEDMPDIEKFALSLCKGDVLDIGAGVGSHALALQAKGFSVSALEISTTASSIMKMRGVERVINEDVFNFNTMKFDTLLLLMNGIGLVGNLEDFPVFLDLMKGLLIAGGQLIFDSSDISYLYAHDRADKETSFLKGKYYGEISYQYEYKQAKGDWFNWLYIDQERLFEVASTHGWNIQIIYEDHQDQYLARLTVE